MICNYNLFSEDPLEFVEMNQKQEILSREDIEQIATRHIALNGHVKISDVVNFMEGKGISGKDARYALRNLLDYNVISTDCRFKLFVPEDPSDNFQFA